MTGNMMNFSRKKFCFFLIFALIIRLAFLEIPLSYHADELFQYLEQAHRLVFGYGVTTWEYRYGIRSWLFPAMLSAPMSLGALWFPGTSAYLLLPKICLILISLFSVGAAYRLGRLISAQHAYAAVAVTAIWSEFVLFSGQALTDSVTVPLFLLGASFLYGERSNPRIVVAGFLLALAAILRFQYAPAIALFVLLACYRNPRALVLLAVGGMVAIAGSVAVDLRMGTAPFGWVLQNLSQNIVAGRAATFGTEGALFYPLEILRTWHIFAIPILGLAWFGSRYYPALFATALFNIALHSIIAHKEYRFILLSTMTLTILAALGTVEAARRAKGKYPDLKVVPIAIAAWTSASLLVVIQPLKPWLHATPGLAAFDQLRRTPRLCGVAMFDTMWVRGGAYTYLNRNIPLYAFDLLPLPDAMLHRHQGGFNAIVAPPPAAARLPAGYSVQHCYGTSSLLSVLSPEDQLCIFQRAGSCTHQPVDVTINAALRLSDK